MELRHINAFLAVAEELHFGRAARRLQMAQPPLSQQIRQLERNLGVQLFERTTRSVRLTSAGQALLEPARTVLADLDLATRAAKAAGRGEFGRVAVGFAGASSHATLPRLTRAVSAAHPGVELVLEGQTYADVALRRVAEGSLDLGFVRLPVTRPGVRVRVIAEEELVCALPSDHPLARRARIPVGALAGQRFVTFPANAGSTLRDATVQACQDAGFVPRVVQEAPDSHTILALVAAGVGVTLTLTSCVHVQQTGLVYRPLARTPIRLQAALAWRADNPSAALRTVLAVAEQALPTPAAAAAPPAPPGPAPPPEPPPASGPAAAATRRDPLSVR